MTYGPGNEPIYPIDPANVAYNDPEAPTNPSALAESGGYNWSNVAIYVVGLIAILVIFGVVAFIVIRKRKQNSENTETASVTSKTSSNISDAATYLNA